MADAEHLLLAPSGLDQAALARVLAEIHDHDVEFADLYFQHARFEGWSLEEGIVKSGTFNIDRGVGVRAVSADKQAYAYSDDISLDALTEAAHAVRAIGRQGQSVVTALRARGGARALRESAGGGAHGVRGPIGSQALAKPTRSRCSRRSSKWRARAIRASPT